MSKIPKALLQLPPQTEAALSTLGAHLAVGRIRRRLSQRTWAQRMGVSVPTLARMESGDPSVAMGLYATALWLLGRDGELSRIAAPEHDAGALELNVREAVELGRQRALAAQQSHQARVTAKAQLAAKEVV